MNFDNENLEWKLCEAYFSILDKNMTSLVSLDQLSVEAKISKDEVEKILSNNSTDYKVFFLKILISKVDGEVLTELKADIFDDNISSTYDKILEGFILRFEKYMKYRGPFKILCKSSKQKINVFLNVFKENYNFSSNLLTLIEDDQNCGIKTLKCLALNVVFTKCLDIFLKDENQDIEGVMRYLDKYLSDVKDLGIFVGIIKD